MAEELMACPFCGGEAKEFTGEDAAPHRWTVECDSCGAHVGSDTRHKARAKWNRRAERTADVEVSHGSHGPEPRFPGDVWTMHHVCSACGGAVDKGDSYCRHCGARLERKEDA